MAQDKPGSLYGLSRNAVPIRFVKPYVPMTRAEKAKRKLADALHKMAFRLGWRE